MWVLWLTLAVSCTVLAVVGVVTWLERSAKLDRDQAERELMAARNRIANERLCPHVWLALDTVWACELCPKRIPRDDLHVPDGAS